MKALTLQRPWDWAMAHGGKNIENRTWRPRSVVGQRIALHAGHGFDEMGRDFILATKPPAVWAVLETPGGVIVATTFVVGWLALPNGGGDLYPPGRSATLLRAVERSPWAFGPVCWVCRDTYALPKPIPCVGAQGLWTVPREIEIAIAAQNAGTPAHV